MRSLTNANGITRKFGVPYRLRPFMFLIGVEQKLRPLGGGGGGGEALRYLPFGGCSRWGYLVQRIFVFVFCLCNASSDKARFRYVCFEPSPPWQRG